MSLKKLFSLLIVFFLMLGIYYYLQFRSSKSNTNYKTVPVPVFDNSEDVLSIEIFRPKKDEIEKNTGIVLSKTNDAWIINSFFNAPADETKVYKLLNVFKNLKGSLRANDPKVFQDFNIDDHQALHIVLKGDQEKELFHILLGKEGPTHNQNFIRLISNSNVYIVYSNIYNLLGMWSNLSNSQPTADAWFDLKLLEIDTDRLQNFKLKTPHALWNLFAHIKHESKSKDAKEKDLPTTEIIWKLPEDFELNLNSEKVKSWANNLNRLQASKIIDPNITLNKESDLYLELKEEDKTSRLDFWFEAKKNEILVKKSNSPTVYSIASYAIQDILYPTNKWFNLENINIKYNNLSQIKVQHPTRSIECKIVDTEWTTSSPLPSLELEKDNIKPIVNKLKNLHFHDILQSTNINLFENAPKLILTKKDQTQLYIKLGSAINIFGEIFYPMQSSDLNLTYLISKEAYNDFFPPYNNWSETPIISEDELDSYLAAQINIEGQILKYDEADSDQEEPEWYEELYNVLESSYIIATADNSTQNLSEEFKPLFVELTFENGESKKMALGRLTQQETKYYVEFENPFVIYEINGEMYDILSGLKTQTKEDTSNSLI